MKRYRKKPIVIEAEQFTDTHIEARILDKVPLPKGVTMQSANYHREDRHIFGTYFYVVTIHGQKTQIEAGDWILPEPDGLHFYPCKPDIFAATYEPVE